MAEVSMPSARTVNAQRLTLLLEEAGWRLVGGRRGIYNRLAPPGSEHNLSGSLVVPLDSSAPEYYELMHAALSLLSSPQYYDLWQRDISPRLSAESTDEFRFRKDSAAPSGLIAWKQGEGLIESARATLVAGAKSFMEPGRRYYGNRHGQFANRYLDTVLMGQTAAGSYVITAYAPANTSVPLKGSQSQVLGLEGVDLTPARQVSTAIVKAVEATVEALEHHRATGSLSGFEARVEAGVSYEMVTALRGITRDADEAEISIEWDPAEPVDDGPAALFQFRGSDATVLEKVGSRFAAAEPEEHLTVTGRVHLLTKKEAGGPGVFGIETLGKPPRKIRVRLSSEEDYHGAVRAHDQDLAVRVSGDMTREGSMYWLYNARLVEVLGNYMELAKPSMQSGQIDGQHRLFDDFASDN